MGPTSSWTEGTLLAQRYAWPVVLRGKARSLLLLSAAALSVAGCYSFSEPSFDPGDQRDVLQSIVRRGLLVGDALPGQTACDDPALVGNSLFLTVRMREEDAPAEVWVHTYREKSWEASASEVDACQAEYTAAHPGAEITRLDVPTFRVFGADWSADLTRELRAAFEEASQAGR